MNPRDKRTGAPRRHCRSTFSFVQGPVPHNEPSPQPLTPTPRRHPRSPRGGIEHLKEELVRAHRPWDLPPLLPHMIGRVGRGRLSRPTRRRARCSVEGEVPIDSLHRRRELGCGEWVARYPRRSRDGLGRGALPLCHGGEGGVDEAGSDPASCVVGRVAEGVVTAEAELGGTGRGVRSGGGAVACGGGESSAQGRGREGGAAA